MGSGNGAKAATARARAAKDKAPAKSQLKNNTAACSIICGVCKQPFLQTAKAPMLTVHAENKHSKTLKDCFPEFVAA